MVGALAYGLSDSSLSTVRMSVCSATSRGIAMAASLFRSRTRKRNVTEHDLCWPSRWCDDSGRPFSSCPVLVRRSLGLFAIAKLIERPRSATACFRSCRAAVISLLLSMIQTLPGLELAAQSSAPAQISHSHERVLQRPRCSTSFGQCHGIFNHEGGAGITDTSYYLYSGFLYSTGCARFEKQNAAKPGLLLSWLRSGTCLDRMADVPARVRSSPACTEFAPHPFLFVPTGACHACRLRNRLATRALENAMVWPYCYRPVFADVFLLELRSESSGIRSR